MTSSLSNTSALQCPSSTIPYFLRSKVKKEPILESKTSDKIENDLNTLDSLDNLHTQGYKVYKGAFSSSEKVLTSIVSQAKKATAIFNHSLTLRKSKFLF